ncbi:Uncharacterised protein [uncultured archaeon]|nr:Uncharacterised protein [uncultured archaeon]
MKRVNNKSGQVTAFVIIAIMLVAFILLYFLFRKTEIQVEKVDPSILPVYNYVDNCVKQTGQEAVSYIGQTGGYFVKPNLSTENNIAYYFDRGNNYMPTKEIIEKELSLYMNNMLFFCVKGFNDFSDFNISQKEINTKAKINDGVVSFDVTYPISATKSGKTYAIQKFSTDVPVRLNVIYTVLEKIMQEQMANKNDICITCLDDFATENDLYIEMYNYNEGTVIFTIRDDNSKLNKESYRFNFANRY